MLGCSLPWEDGSGPADMDTDQDWLVWSERWSHEGLVREPRVRATAMLGV